MLKSNDHTATVEQEFTLLENVLNQTADDAVRCLKLLKKNLSDYDHHHGNHFINTATSFMRNDMRTAKDTASDLKHVAHQINKNPQPSELDIDSARNMMNVVAKSMDALNTTARNYDEKNGRSKGVQGVIDNAVGKNDQEKHEKDGGLFGKGDRNTDEKHAGHLGTTDANHSGGLLGKTGDHHHHGGGVFNSSDAVEQLVKKTLHDNFSISALNGQITNAEKSLSSSPSFVERVKETHGGHHGYKHVVAP
ncbi:unnamed protein product [Peronospora destructor]|uniref:Uncharacterized protein n=1 Tax=Peronospora destructor TaxID=86335 RepID=A0AAV0V894_9STRA|nr:unnamed protein product [Peronospora destructor]CAI5743840.1 unnamed protein product [Peronospora destructor]CAI5743843.1 unnamed protein product [Peronospora destructor]